MRFCCVVSIVKSWLLEFIWGTLNPLTFGIVAKNQWACLVVNLEKMFSDYS